MHTVVTVDDPAPGVRLTTLFETALPNMSFSVTVTVDVAVPLAVTFVVGFATTVESVAEGVPAPIVSDWVTCVPKAAAVIVWEPRFWSPK